MQKRVRKILACCRANVLTALSSGTLEEIEERSPTAWKVFPSWSAGSASRVAMRVWSLDGTKNQSGFVDGGRPLYELGIKPIGSEAVPVRKLQCSNALAE